jgi:hypothetical protein
MVCVCGGQLMQKAGGVSRQQPQPPNKVLVLVLVAVAVAVVSVERLGYH